MASDTGRRWRAVQEEREGRAGEKAANVRNSSHPRHIARCPKIRAKWSHVRSRRPLHPASARLARFLDAALGRGLDPRRPSWNVGPQRTSSPPTSTTARASSTAIAGDSYRVGKRPLDRQPALQRTRRNVADIEALVPQRLRKAALRDPGRRLRASGTTVPAATATAALTHARRRRAAALRRPLRVLARRKHSERRTSKDLHDHYDHAG